MKMEITGKSVVCGLIGNPVEHTLSPLIHNTLSEQMNLETIYVPFPVKNNLEDAIKGAYALGIQGLNVTVPYKSDVIAILKDIDPIADKIGAVNTLVRIEGGYKGYNTDIIGLSTALSRRGVSLQGKKVVLIGAGGAARAVAFLCASEGAASILIWNRSVEKGEQLAKEVSEHYPSCEFTVAPLSEESVLPGDGYIAIQCTSVGLSPKDDMCPVTSDAFYEKLSFAFDLIYKPYTTKFLEKAATHGVPIENGLSMLLYQGVAAYELFHEVKVSQELAEKTYAVLQKGL